MNKKTIIKNIAAIVLNLFIFLNVTIILIGKPKSFETYTVLSNIFLAITSLTTAINIIIKFKKESPINITVAILKYSSIVTIVITYLTVIIYLDPIWKGINFSNTRMLFFHHINPLVALLTYLFLENKPKFSFKFFFVGMVPIVTYGIVYFVNILGFNNWRDFYHLLVDGSPIPALVIFIFAAFLLSVGIYFLRNFIGRKRSVE